MPPLSRSPFRAPLAGLIAVGLVVLAVLPGPSPVATRDTSSPVGSHGAPAPAPVAAGEAAAFAHAADEHAAAVWYAEVTRQAEAQASRRATVHTDPSVEYSGDGSTVSSTAYCLTGGMADGEPARYGAVAGNRWPLGTRLRVTPSPVGQIVTVEDRIGSGSELDFAMPGDCAAARAWGRRAVTVEVVTDG